MFLYRCKLGDTVRIGETITVTLVKDQDDESITILGIDAPQNMYIRKLREDLEKARIARAAD